MQIFRLSDGSVSEVHLEKATEVLESFDVVFVLETMEFMVVFTDPFSALKCTVD